MDVESVTDAPEKGKSKLLLAAYEKAAEQHDLDYFKEMLVDHQKAIQEDQEAQAQREAKKASKAKRKSQDAAAQAAAAEEMDVDEELPEPKPKSKKRKKDLDSDAGEEKVRITNIKYSPIILTNDTASEDPQNSHETQAFNAENTCC